MTSTSVCVLRNTFLTSFLKPTAFAGGGGGAPVMGGAAAGGGAAPAGDAAAEEKKEEKKEEEEESEDDVDFSSLHIFTASAVFFCCRQHRHRGIATVTTDSLLCHCRTWASLCSTEQPSRG